MFDRGGGVVWCVSGPARQVLSGLVASLDVYTVPSWRDKQNGQSCLDSNPLDGLKTFFITLPEMGVES